MAENDERKILVYVTCSNLVEAEMIVKELLQRRLIACGTVGTHAHSYFRWEGRNAESTEYQVVLKSSMRCFSALEQEVRRMHSYDVPEILAVPVLAGSEPYLRWMEENLKP